MLRRYVSCHSFLSIISSPSIWVIWVLRHKFQFIGFDLLVFLWSSQQVARIRIFLGFVLMSATAPHGYREWRGGNEREGNVIYSAFKWPERSIKIMMRSNYWRFTLELLHFIQEMFVEWGKMQENGASIHWYRVNPFYSGRSQSRSCEARVNRF